MDLEPGNIVYIDREPTDAEKAEKYRKELTESLKPVIEILERAKRDGLVVQWNIAADEFGRIRVPFINVTKPL